MNGIYDEQRSGIYATGQERECRMEGNKMSARQYLGQTYLLDQRISSMVTQIALLRSNALNITANIHEVSVQTSHDNTKMENTIVKIMQQESEMNREIDRLIDLKEEVRQVIGRVPNVEYRLLLELRYLCFKNWEEIAVEMNYSMDYVFKMHRKALEMVQVPE